MEWGPPGQRPCHPEIKSLSVFSFINGPGTLNDSCKQGSTISLTVPPQGHSPRDGGWENELPNT